jgi:hypothetical protein
MHHLMPRKKHLALALSVLLATVWIAPGLAQDKLTSIHDPAFDDPQSIPVTFNHNAHNAKAGLKDCATCHHVYNREGQVVAGAASVDQKCSDCHRVRPAAGDFAPALMLAFHKRCQNCHIERNKGPVECGGCHKR